MSLFVRMVNVPPYCGTPSLSHQFPVAAFVVDDVVIAGLVVVVEVGADVTLVVEVGMDVVLVVVLVVVFDAAQDESNIAVSIKKLKHNQIHLFFNFLLLFINLKHIFTINHKLCDH